MSKFIRLTQSDGREVILNAAHIRSFGKAVFPKGSPYSFVDLVLPNRQMEILETPEQILALIEGDEQRERIAFLESALWDAKMLLGISVTPKGDFYAEGWSQERKMSNSFAQWLREVGA